jgi:hypothetical protein
MVAGERRGMMIYHFFMKIALCMILATHTLFTITIYRGYDLLETSRCKNEIRNATTLHVYRNTTDNMRRPCHRHA